MRIALRIRPSLVQMFTKKHVQLFYGNVLIDQSDCNKPVTENTDFPERPVQTWHYKEPCSDTGVPKNEHFFH
jgi:hypothetical protein